MFPFHCQSAMPSCTNHYLDTTFAVDDVVWQLYPTSIGTNPITAQPTQVIQNNDFNSGSLDPWTTSQTAGRADIGVTNGQARITFSRIVPQYTSPSWIIQTIPLAQRSQTYTLQADVSIVIPSGSTNCVAQISAGQEIWQSGTVYSSQTYALRDLRGTLQSDTGYFYLYASCTGQGVPYVTFDNVYWTLNT